MARLTADRALAAGLLKPEAAEALLDVLAGRSPPVTRLRARPARDRRAERGRRHAGPRSASVGVVMSLGALHDGHRALIRAAPAALRRRRRHGLPQPAAVRAERGPRRATRAPSTPTWRCAARRASSWCSRPTSTRSTPTAPVGAGRRRPARRRARGRVAAGPLRRRAHRRRQAAAHHRPGRRRSSARRTPSRCCSCAGWCTDLDFPLRVVDDPDRPRARRARAVQPQRLPLRRRPRRRARAVALAARPASAAAGSGAGRRARGRARRARRAAGRGLDYAAPASTRRRSATCPRTSPARRCSSSPRGSARPG